MACSERCQYKLTISLSFIPRLLCFRALTHINPFFEQSVTQTRKNLHELVLLNNTTIHYQMLRKAAPVSSLQSCRCTYMVFSPLDGSKTVVARSYRCCDLRRFATLYFNLQRAGDSCRGTRIVSLSSSKNLKKALKSAIFRLIPHFVSWHLVAPRGMEKCKEGAKPSRLHLGFFCLHSCASLRPAYLLS